MKRLMLSGFIAVLAAAAPAALQAQDDSVLTKAVRLAQEGHGDSARAQISQLLSATPTSDPRYPGMLYTMGLISPSAQGMTRNLQRVAVEYAGSEWADDARLRLAQLDFAAGDMPAALRNIQRLRSDYPTSPLRPLAAFWGARAYFEMGKAPEACGLLQEGIASSGQNIEVRNQLSFYEGRCQGVTAVKPSAAAAAAMTRPLAPVDPTPRPVAPVDDSAGTPLADPGARAAAFSVQVAAVSTRSAADRVAADLKAAGLEPVIVLEEGLYKVRFGRFQDRAQAQAAASQIRRRVGGKPFTVPVP